MKKNIFIFIFLLTCFFIQAQKKKSFVLQVFKNLETLKCIDGGVDRHLTESGYFESVGRKANYQGYSTFSNLKDYISVLSFDNAIGYYMESSNPDVYNYIRKNGNYSGVETDLYYKTTLVYYYNNSKISIRKNEVYGAGNLYIIWSDCGL